jgi:hypothetical protein
MDRVKSKAAPGLISKARVVEREAPFVMSGFGGDNDQEVVILQADELQAGRFKRGDIGIIVRAPEGVTANGMRVALLNTMTARRHRGWWRR